MIKDYFRLIEDLLNIICGWLTIIFNWLKIDWVFVWYYLKTPILTLSWKTKFGFIISVEVSTNNCQFDQDHWVIWLCLTWTQPKRLIVFEVGVLQFKVVTQPISTGLLGHVITMSQHELWHQIRVSTKSKLKKKIQEAIHVSVFI